MSAVALTDTGNMMAAFHFTRAVDNHNKSAEPENQLKQKTKTDITI